MWECKYPNQLPRTLNGLYSASSLVQKPCTVLLILCVNFSSCLYICFHSFVTYMSKYMYYWYQRKNSHNHRWVPLFHSIFSRWELVWRGGKSMLHLHAGIQKMLQGTSYTARCNSRKKDYTKIGLDSAYLVSIFNTYNLILFCSRDKTYVEGVGPT